MLQIKDLSCVLDSPEGLVFAVNNLNLELKSGEIHAIVGESGSGKSVTARTILGLTHSMSKNKSKYPLVTGEVLFKGRNLLKINENDWQSLRGREISMIFQDPGSALSPLMKAGDQIAEAITNHFRFTKAELSKKVAALLEKAGLPPRTAELYPFELSGGMQQRVMIAAAIACSTSVLIADEATTALDVTIQKQILALLQELQKELSLSVLFITHNLALVGEIADRASVMYAGQILETASAKTLLSAPLHPYTKGLLECVPKVKGQDAGSAAPRKRLPLHVIPGFPPRLKEAPYLCPFAPRCESAFDECRAVQPTWREISAGRGVKCLKNF